MTTTYFPKQKVENSLNSKLEFMFPLVTLITKRFRRLNCQGWLLYRLQRKLQVHKTKAKGKKQSTVCEDAASAKRPRSVGVSSKIYMLFF